MRNVLHRDLVSKAASLPRLPGVYTFHDEAGAALYIGKSVDIRRRVLDHLRAPDEQRLVGRTDGFSCIRTAGDIGAQLLEARLIKQAKPLFNRKLRRNKRLCTIVLAADGVRIEDVHGADPAQAHGLFPGRHAAIAALQRLADEHQLCYGRLGIESVRAGAPCFRHLLRRCAGACNGSEPASAHDERLRGGLAGYHRRAWPTPAQLASTSARRTCGRSMWCVTGRTWARRRRSQQREGSIRQQSVLIVTATACLQGHWSVRR